MTSSNGIVSTRESVGSVASRLRMIEDYNLASRLQDQEFDYHYAMNRAQRQLVGKDIKASRKEQENEDRNAELLRHHNLKTIAENDAYLAMQLQQEIEEKERLRKERIAQLDAAFARDLEIRERKKMEEKYRMNIEAADEKYARELQEYYNSRLKKNRHGIASKKPSFLPSFITKSSKNQRVYNSSTQQAFKSENHVNWADTVDESTQNELNAQMANIAVESRGYNGPPPAYSALDNSLLCMSDKSYPLATIATRDSSVTSSGLNEISRTCLPNSLTKSVDVSNDFHQFQHDIVPNSLSCGVSYNPLSLHSEISGSNSFGGLSHLVPNSNKNSSPFSGSSDTKLDNNNNSPASSNTLAAQSCDFVKKFHPTNPFIADLVILNPNTENKSLGCLSTPSQNEQKPTTSANNFECETALGLTAD